MSVLPRVYDLVYARRAEYRSAIFFHTPEQETIARRVTEEVQKKHFDTKGEQILALRF